MSDISASRRPRAFRLDDTHVVTSDGTHRPHIEDVPPGIEEQPDHYEAEAQGLASPGDEQVIERAQERGIVARTLFSWSGLFWSALGGLVSLALGLWVTKLIDDLFARAQPLGYIGLTLLALALLALAVLAGRELYGIVRQRHIARLHMALAKAREGDDRNAARTLLRDLVGIYAKRPETARARAHVEELTREIVDGRDLIDIAERQLVHPLDEQVRREIANAARRVSIVTAVSPRAIVDLAFVAAQILRLVRRIAEIYGGRPGLLGFLKLLRSVGAHLAVTGGMAVGDSLVQQLLGHGIAARLSAKLGEGVLNGLLTTRVGLSAMAVCRPMPFAVEEPPGVSDVAPFLFSSGRKDA